MNNPIEEEAEMIGVKVTLGKEVNHPMKENSWRKQTKTMVNLVGEEVLEEEDPSIEEEGDLMELLSVSDAIK